MSECPESEQLDAFIDGKMHDDDRGRIELHIDTCESCQTALRMRCSVLLPISYAASMTNSNLSAADYWNSRYEARLLDAMPHDESVADADENFSGNASLPEIPGYRVERLLGRGGMGAVYLGIQTDLNREVAIKVLDTRRSRDAERLAQRFSHEAQITANLNHPSIVPVHAVGRDAEGRLYYTMRRVVGRELKEILQLARREQQGWNRSRAISVLVRICQTVEFAHTHGVIHRDLKPSNIMVGQLGEVYVLDWGLAKAIGRQDIRDVRPDVGNHTNESQSQDSQSQDNADLSFGDPPSSQSPRFSQSIGANSNSQAATDETNFDASNRIDRVADDIDTRPLTRADMTELESRRPLKTVDGSVIGTPAFMSPEQASGHLDQIDQRSDIYALGTILYQLLVGKPPYVSGDKSTKPVEILKSILDGPPQPITEISPDCPAELAAVCKKAMARDKNQRYHSAVELADDMQAYLDDRVVAAYASGAIAGARKWVRRNRAVAMASALAIVLAMTGLVANSLLQIRSNRVLSRANQKVSNSLAREQTAKQAERDAKLEAFQLLAQSYTNFAEDEILDGKYSRAAVWHASAAALTENDDELREIRLMRAKQCTDSAFMPVAAWWDRELVKSGRIKWPMTRQFHVDRTGTVFCVRDGVGSLILRLIDGGHRFELWKNERFQSAAVSADGQFAAVTRDSQTIDLYRIDDESKICSANASAFDLGKVTAMDFSASGKRLAVQLDKYKIFDVVSQRWLAGSYPAPNKVIEFGINDVDTQFLTHVKNQVKVYDIVDSDDVHRPVLTKNDTTSKRSSAPDEIDQLCSSFLLRQRSGSDPRGTPFDIKGMLSKFGDHGEESVHGAIADMENRRIVVAHGAGTFRTWRIPEERYRILKSDVPVRPVISESGPLLVLVSQLHVYKRPDSPAPPILTTTQVYDPLAARPAGPELAVGQPILHGCFSPDGELLVLACGAKNRKSRDDGAGRWSRRQSSNLGLEKRRADWRADRHAIGAASGGVPSQWSRTSSELCESRSRACGCRHT